MRIEVYKDGVFLAGKEVSELEISYNPYEPFERNCERRERIINSYINEISRELRPILRGYVSYQLAYRLVFQSKMNSKWFVIKEDNQLKTA
jgi:hypothetical protein